MLLLPVIILGLDMKPPALTLWTRLWLSLVFGLGLAGLGYQTVAANNLTERPVLPRAPLAPPAEVEERPLITYARVLTGPVPIFSDPQHATLGLTPTRTLEPGYVWVTLASTQTVQLDDRLWYSINRNEFVPAEFLEVYQPSQFSGMQISVPKTFAWIVFDTWTAPAPGQPPGDESLLLTRYSLATIYDTQTVNERNWYQVGPDQWIEQGMVGIVSPKPRPKGIGPTDKWIEVDLYEQTLAAYEGDRMVYATLVSSGLPWWQTEQGLFQIWVKIREAKMSGREGYPDHYFLEDVPWTMYFNRDFALHGAYWHDRFGLQHSRGCVNLSLTDARWLYEWATPTHTSGWTLATEENPGAWVWVHDSSQAEFASLPQNMETQNSLLAPEFLFTQ